jgi:nitroimidazol reductase NimA-like FMN-containing flavoprotein (pyridoxamine 5'-phosphate oxidase superfamily)
MDEDTKRKVVELLDQHRIMTVATNRPDGWPQATTVGYVNDGLTLYFLCGPKGQKAQNLAKDNRLSLTVDHDTSDPMAITGLSMAALAYPVDDPREAAKAMRLLGTRYRNTRLSLCRNRKKSLSSECCQRLFPSSIIRKGLGTPIWWRSDKPPRQAIPSSKY